MPRKARLWLTTSTIGASLAVGTLGGCAPTLRDSIYASRANVHAPQDGDGRVIRRPTGEETALAWWSDRDR